MTDNNQAGHLQLYGIYWRENLIWFDVSKVSQLFQDEHPGIMKGNAGTHQQRHLLLIKQGRDDGSPLEARI